MTTTTCDATVKNEMAIAILNSDIGDHCHHEHDHSSSSEGHDHSSSSSSSSSSESWEHGQAPCYAHFDTRYAVGTHAAGWHEIKKFSSKAARGFYVRFIFPLMIAQYLSNNFFFQIHDNEYTMRAAATLRSCLSNRCCDSTFSFWDVLKEAGQCYITTNCYGDAEIDFDDHAGEDV